MQVGLPVVMTFTGAASLPLRSSARRTIVSLSSLATNSASPPGATAKKRGVFPPQPSHVPAPSPRNDAKSLLQGFFDEDGGESVLIETQVESMFRRELSNLCLSILLV